MGYRKKTLKRINKKKRFTKKNKSKRKYSRYNNKKKRKTRSNLQHGGWGGKKEPRTRIFLNQMGGWGFIRRDIF